MEVRKYWIKVKRFIHEHSGYGMDEIDRLEILDFLLLVNECEEIAEMKKDAWEK